MTAVFCRDRIGMAGRGFSSVEVDRLMRKRRSELERETVEDLRSTFVVVRQFVVESKGREFLRSVLVWEGVWDSELLDELVCE